MPGRPDRAATLTAAPELRAARLAAAANAAWSAGQPDRARALLDQAAPLAGGAPLQATIAHLRASIESNCGIPAVAYAMLIGASELVTATDAAHAAQMLGEAGQLAWAGGDLTRLREVNRRLTELSERTDVGAVGAQVIMGLSGLLTGDTTATAARLREAADLAGSSKEPRALMGAAAGAMFIGDDSRAIDLFCNAVALTRAAAEVASLPLLLAPLAMVETLTSRYTAALADATEGLRLAEETGQHNPAAHLRGVLALIAAVQGRAQDCRDHAGAALTQAIDRRLGPHAAIASWALAALDLGSGRPAESFDRLEALAAAGPGEGNQIVMLMATADLVEAAVRANRQPPAGCVDKLHEWASDTGAPWATALVLRCRALLASDDDQDRHFTEALRLHAPAGRPFDTARTQLLFGESLRRRRRRADARKHLRAAHETFERLGATPWAEQAGKELLATGETARRRDVSNDRPAHTPGAADLSLRRPGRDQPRHRHVDVPQPADRRLPPAQDLQQTRPIVARGADPHVRELDDDPSNRLGVRLVVLSMGRGRHALGISGSVKPIIGGLDTSGLLIHGLTIELRDVVRQYRIGGQSVRALDNISLRLAGGQFVSIVGPSGAGKSTLLHLLGALDSPDSGSISFDGMEIGSLGDEQQSEFRHHRVGFVFQFFNLLPTLSAWENVAVPKLLDGVRLGKAKPDAVRLLNRVGLGNRTEHRPSEMSGGQMQRVAVARAMMMDPPLILADEPTGNLDSTTGASILELLAEVAHEEGRSRLVVMVTHNPDAARATDRVITLQDGRVGSDELQLVPW